VDRLYQGGIGTPRAALPRTVNAALMRKSGILKTEDGRYFRDEDFVDPDDLPFDTVPGPPAPIGLTAPKEGETR